MAIVEIDVYGCLCSLRKFVINNIDANYDDFGDKYDHNEDEADELAEYIENKYDGVEVTIFDGQQPVYSYIISVE